MWSVGLGIGITALVGLFFGIYPAMQARLARSDRGAAKGMTATDMAIRLGLFKESS